MLAQVTNREKIQKRKGNYEKEKVITKEKGKGSSQIFAVDNQYSNV